MNLTTLFAGFRPFKLKDPRITNDKLAEVMRVRRYFRHQHPGTCRFWRAGLPIAAIRVTRSLLVVLSHSVGNFGQCLIRDGIASPIGWNEVLDNNLFPGAIARISKL